VLALRDPVTGLAGRSLFEEILLVQIATVRRERRQCGVLYADIEQLSRVNALLGDAAGDTLLRLVGERVRGALRASDTVGRLAGDELGAIVPAVFDDAVIVVAEKVRRVCTGWYFAHGEQHSLRVSVGSSVCPDDGRSVHDLIRRAEAAMHRIKVADRQIFGRYGRCVGAEYVLDRARSP
jgi:diguanylate cyclase (GGDEF)-like protein